MVALPLTDLRRFDTHRLLPAKYSPNYDSVLTRIADNDEDLQRIFELDNATNARLLAEENRSPGISQRELVFHVPNYRVINAAFTHSHPLGARFSTPERGAWAVRFDAIFRARRAECQRLRQSPLLTPRQSVVQRLRRAGPGTMRRFAVPRRNREPFIPKGDERRRERIPRRH